MNKKSVKLHVERMYIAKHKDILANPADVEQY